MHETLNHLTQIWLVGLAHHRPAAIIPLFLLWWLMVRTVIRPQRRRSRVRYRASDSFPSRPPSRPVSPPPQQVVIGQRTGGSLPAAMPEPSDAVAPVERPCRHEEGVEAVIVGGELMRYTCANWRCTATWPPGAKFPAGTVIVGGDQ